MPKNNISKNSLSKREHEVLSLLLKGKSNKEISTLLFVCENTVEKHLTNLYGKLGVRSRSEAILQEISQGRDFRN